MARYQSRSDSLFDGICRVACTEGRKAATNQQYSKSLDSCLVIGVSMKYYGGPLLAHLFGIGEFDAKQNFCRVAKTYELIPGQGTEAPAGNGATIQCGAYADMKGWTAEDSLNASPYIGLSGFGEKIDSSSEYGRSKHMGSLALRIFATFGEERVLVADCTLSVSGATEAAVDLAIAMEVEPFVELYVEERTSAQCAIEFPGRENAKLMVLAAFKGE